jgi:hypothetical protein
MTDLNNHLRYCKARKRGFTTIYIGMNGIVSTTHTERRYFLGRFKGPWLFEIEKNWFQRLGTEKGGVWFKGSTLPKKLLHILSLTVHYSRQFCRLSEFRIPISLRI